MTNYRISSYRPPPSLCLSLSLAHCHSRQPTVDVCDRPVVTAQSDHQRRELTKIDHAVVIDIVVGLDLQVRVSRRRHDIVGGLLQQQDSPFMSTATRPAMIGLWLVAATTGDRRNDWERGWTTGEEKQQLLLVLVDRIITGCLIDQNSWILISGNDRGFIGCSRGRTIESLCNKSNLLPSRSKTVNTGVWRVTSCGG